MASRVHEVANAGTALVPRTQRLSAVPIAYSAGPAARRTHATNRLVLSRRSSQRVTARSWRTTTRLSPAHRCTAALCFAKLNASAWQSGQAVKFAAAHAYTSFGLPRGHPACLNNPLHIRGDREQSVWLRQPCHQAWGSPMEQGNRPDRGPASPLTHPPGCRVARSATVTACAALPRTSPHTRWAARLEWRKPPSPET